MYEAACAKCGETFNPADRNDLIHGAREDGAECGGRGHMVGEWGTPADDPTEATEHALAVTLGADAATLRAIAGELSSAGYPATIRDLRRIAESMDDTRDYLNR